MQRAYLPCWQSGPRRAFLPAFSFLPLLLVVLSDNPLEVFFDLLPIAGFLSKPLTREKVATLLAQHFEAV